MRELKNLATLKKILPHTWSQQPPVSLPPIWPPWTSHSATSGKPHFHLYFWRSCSIIFLQTNFYHICRKDQRSAPDFNSFMNFCSWKCMTWYWKEDLLQNDVRQLTSASWKQRYWWLSMPLFGVLHFLPGHYKLPLLKTLLLAMKSQW